MLQNLDISAAPHLPPALRPAAERHVLADFLFALNGELQIVEENGELRLVSYPNAGE